MMWSYFHNKSTCFVGDINSFYAKNIKSAQIRQYSNQNSNVMSYIKTNRIDGVQYLKQNEECCLLHTKQNIYVINLVNYKHTAFISSRSLAASPG